MANVKITDLTAVSSISPAADVVALVSGGSTKKATPTQIVNSVLNGATSIGIGTASPGGVLSITAAATLPALAITNTGTGHCLLIEDSTSTDTTPFVIDNAGNVGIGNIPSGSYKLQVTGTASVTGHLTLEGVTSTGATGTGKFVFDGTPTLVTPILGTATGTSLTVSNGFCSTSTYSPTFSDGIVVDYSSGNGRISVGTADTITFYNGGVANTIVGILPTAGSGGIIPSEQFCCSTSTNALTSSTALQKVFNTSTNGALTVAAATTYFFECMLNISGMSATSGNMGFSIVGAGTATFTSAGWQAIGLDATTLTTATAMGGIYSAASAQTGDIVLAGTGTAVTVIIKGVMRINAGGTIIPSIQLTTASSAIVGVNSWFKCSPVGSNIVTSVGNWS